MAGTNLAAFLRVAGHDDYESLHRWSVADLDGFWALAWDHLGVVGDRGERVVLHGDSLPDTRFFPDARLNVAENILAGDASSVMVESVDELGRSRTFTRGEIAEQVAAFAAALRADGVAAGDRVVAWMPNVAESLVVMLAAASIGAVYSSTSPDFGVDGVLDRFGQIEPVVLVAADGYHYGGKRLDCLDRLEEIAKSLPTLRRVVIFGNLEWGEPAVSAPWPSIADAVGWDDYLAAHRGRAAQFEPLPFDHPWYVLFSSGTTGVPKCIVHRAGGVLLQHLKEHQLHCDIRAEDRVLYYTTCGWMMWNWLASVPASGATAVFYDGSPFHPGPSALMDLASQERLTFLGVSAKYLDSLHKSGLRPVREAPIPNVRTIASTGSPLSAETFEWVYEAVSPDVHLASISGGTDLCACFVGGDPTSPVYAGEIQRPALAMAVDVFDDRAEPAPAGQRGELICAEPFPSMPLGFWADDDGSRYRAAYFEAIPGVWTQGDFASRTEHGGFVLHGRSDTTLNPGGVRIGTAEIYRHVEQMPEVLEALVFGQEWQNDTRIVLLVRLAEGTGLTDELADEIRARIRTGCTPRHVPGVVAAVTDLPRTRSGKLAELAVSDAVNGRPVRNTSALANPETLETIAGLSVLGRD